MNKDQEMSELSPSHFVEAALGFQKTAAIKAALALDLFTAIASEEGDIDKTAKRVKASVRGIRILCDYLTVHGFLTKTGVTYELTPSTAAFLTTSSPAWMGSVVEFLAAPEMMSHWLADPVAIVRNGGSNGAGSLAPDNPQWVTFAKAMVPFIAPVAAGVVEDLRRSPTPPKRVLDVAAGHGMFGIEIAKAFPEAEITALDWAGVLSVAEENAKAAGIANRFHTLVGSAFDVPWGSDYDLVLLTNFLHHFDRDTCVSLLEQSRNALTSTGSALAVDFVPNPDRVSPPFPAAFAFMMLGETPQGDAYTAAEFTEMGHAAGFQQITIKPVPRTPQSLIEFELAI